MCADGAFGACEDAVLPGTEACNAVDDDCDGTVDEGECGCTVDDVQPCGPGAGFGNRGICRAGRTTCGADRAWGPCEGGTGPRDETCDGADEDCDGAVDEVPGLGGACVVGDGVCARDGVLTCVAGEARPQCVAPPPPDLPETCDGVDQDCDGQVDEGVEPGPCTAGVGSCARAGATTCDAGRVGCDAQPGVPAREDCNGRDDDCDGRTDEGALNACGHCGATPVESCNGRDDDCDGRTDERQGVGARCTVGLGVCTRDGFETCAGGRWTCDVAPHPALPEGCNGLDDDCDGTADEGVTNACGGCGVLVETCDGSDDDCDGATDEGFDVGGPCRAGTGACVRDGARACRDGLAVCTAVPGEPRDEVCNAVDDDCDGLADEGLDVGAACTAGAFRCARAGVRVCRDLVAVCDAEPLPATPEVCNEIDDDCDGAVDEGVEHNACGGCGVVPDERCNEADDDCDGAVDEGLPQSPCGGCGPTPREICDDVDNDCDGRVDEAVRNACGGCGAVPTEVCNEVDDDCDGGVDEGLPRSPCGFCAGLAERCDLLDNDCDGAIDEETIEHDAACVVPMARGVCAEGLGECVDGEVVCHQVNDPRDEVCGGLDDDCDRRTDEMPWVAVDTRAPRIFGAGVLAPGPDDRLLAVWYDPARTPATFVTQIVRPDPALVGAAQPAPVAAAAAPSVVRVADGWLLASERAGDAPAVDVHHLTTDGVFETVSSIDRARLPTLLADGDTALLVYASSAGAVRVQRLTADGSSLSPPLSIAASPSALAAALLDGQPVVAYVHTPSPGAPARLAQHLLGDAEGAPPLVESSDEPANPGLFQLIPLPGGLLRVTGPSAQPDTRIVAPDLGTRPVALPFERSLAWATTPTTTWIAGRPQNPLTVGPIVLPLRADTAPGPAQHVNPPALEAVAVAVVDDDLLVLVAIADRMQIARQPLCVDE